MPMDHFSQRGRPVLTSSVLTFARSQSYAGAAAVVLICSIVFMLLVLYVMLEDCRFPPRCDRSHQLRGSFATIPLCALG
jgi:hypothetical protein